MKLVKNKETCCGCGACKYKCPVDAITMREDEKGFIYPFIDENKCINCGLCTKICPFELPSDSSPVACYASANLDDDQKYKSTSGGVFAAIATNFIMTGGVVCGASLKVIKGKVNVKHVLVNNLHDLEFLQGSKYVKSSLDDVLPEIKKMLKKNIKVLFSGTPCQVAAIKKLFTKYDNILYTIDIICHGTPSEKFLNDYLKLISKNELLDLKFRDKQFGWSLKGIASYRNSIRIITPNNSSYYYLFLKGEIYQDSCYKCPYTSKNRVGDLTIGDYWGIQKYNPELIIENNGPFNTIEGVSCLLENTSKGSELIQKSKDTLTVRKIEYENLLHINTQLREPSKNSNVRDRVFNTYEKNGYIGVELIFISEKIKRKLNRIIKRMKNNVTTK